MLKIIKPPPSAVGPLILKKMLSFAREAPEGCFVEVGVYKGGTAFYLTELAAKQKREIYLYDTFEGIPFADNIDIHKVGDFSDTDYNSVKKILPYANVIKGIFPQSSVDMKPIAFAHLDVDQYISYKNSVRYLKDKIVKNGIIWFDDYSMKGCQLALYEEFGNEVIKIGNQAMVKL
jgi:hypothetical protein